ncbi:MAG: glycosyltransferase family 4 protein [Paucibacter sp.]|nr:glycosyltransferase family 4 protein [Roseateles sp.]
MKLALVVPGGVDAGGEERVIPALLDLIERLARVHEVHVFVLRQHGRWPLRGATVHGTGGGALSAVAALRREHAQAPFKLVQTLFSGSCGLAAVLARGVLGLPACVHLGGGERVALPEIGYGGRLGWKSRLCEAIVERGASAISGASAMALAGGPGTRIPLGVALERWPPLAPRPRNALPRLLHVASLNQVKDPGTLLHALALLQARGLDFELDMVGEDTLGGRMQALCAQLGLAARTRWHGFMRQGEWRVLAEQADLHVLSSRHEAGPVVVLEAALAGLPTVGTAVGHLAEWAALPGPAALAVPVGDAAALAQAIEGLLANEQERLRMARAAQAEALREDADHTAALFASLHAAALGR